MSNARTRPRLPALFVTVLVAVLTAALIAVVLVPTLPVVAQAALRGPSAKASSPKTLDVQFVVAINVIRDHHGLPPLEVDPALQQAAADWTMVLVDASELAHAPDLAVGLPAGARAVGENVGRGATVASLMRAFMGSDAHRATLLHERWTHVGVGTVRAPDGRIYTTHRFADLS